MRNEGYTLIEVVVCLFLISLILFGSAQALKALGIVTGNGMEDMVYRKNINKFANDMQNGIHSLLSCENNTYSSITSSGIVINQVDKVETRTLENGSIEKVYKTKDITMYLIGTCQRRDVSIYQDVIQENKEISTYGQIQLKDKKINKTEFDKGNIVWEEESTYEPIKVTTQHFLSGEVKKSEFIVTTLNDKLSSIKFTLLIPTAKGANREFNMVFTCIQEVLVSVK